MGFESSYPHQVFRFASGRIDQTGRSPTDVGDRLSTDLDGFDSRTPRQKVHDDVDKWLKSPGSQPGYRGFESRHRRHAVEHERPSALSFNQVIAGSIPVNGTKIVGL